MNRHTPAALVALALVLGRAQGVQADTVVLRNGQQLQGRMTIEGDKARIELDIGGTVVVSRGEIASSVVDGPSAAATGEAIAVSPELLARLKAREDVHQLLDALLDEKEAPRLKAEAELSQKGREALPMLRAAFAAGPPTQRRHLLRVLAAIGDTASVPKIIEILRNPAESELHVEALKALAAISGHGAAPLLTEFLVNAKDDEVRTECLRALGDLASPYGAPFVVDALRQETLRQTARALVAQWDDPLLLPYLVPYLDDAARENRERVATWLARIVTPGHAVALTRLLELYEDDKDVAKALRGGVTRLHRDFPVVGDVELLAAPQAVIRDAALEALRKQQPDRRKRGNTARDWRDLRDGAVQPHFLLAADAAAGRLLRARDFASDIETSLRTPGAPQAVKVNVSPKTLPTFASADGRPRDARPLLARLDREQAADPQDVRFIGLSTAELSVPGLEVALAPTRPGGSLLISLARLGEARDAVAGRARRLTLHALARSLGLPACTDASCPSTSIYSVQDLDAKSPRYCNNCANAFIAQWAAEHDLASFYYAAAGAKLATIAGRVKTAEACATAAYAYERALLPLAAIEQWRVVQGLGGEPAQGALISKRIEMLDRTERWLNRKKLTTQPNPPAPPAKGGRPPAAP